MPMLAPATSRWRYYLGLARGEGVTRNERLENDVGGGLLNPAAVPIHRLPLAYP